MRQWYDSMPGKRVRAALRQLTKASKASTVFDPEFYSAYYPDLHALKTPAALRRHYRLHGKGEGRFPSLTAARLHFEQTNGPAPADFDVALYQRLNPDLAKLFSHPAQFELHFLEFGRFEERPYSGAGMLENVWHNLLNLYEFNLLNESWLPYGGVGRAEAVVLMHSEGVKRLAPIARGWDFDPAFYRSRYGIDGSDASLYWDWLNDGYPAGRVPNEVQAIAGMLAGRPYPACFDWKRYGKLRRIENRSPQLAKVSALQNLFEQPLESVSRLCISGPGSSDLYEAIGSYHLIRARYAEAADAFRQAIEAGKATARLYLRQGDALKALGDWQNALECFRHALSLTRCSIWALIHATNIMLSQKMFRDAFELVEAQAAHFYGHSLLDGFIDEVAATAYRFVSDTMHAMISDDKQDAVLDNFADRRLGEITDFIRRMKIGESQSIASKGSKRIVMLACLDLAQCTFYRVEQKRRLLAEQGIKVEVFNFNDPAPFMSALPGAAAAIFYRVPCYPKIVESILYANSLGIETFFDIDDLVFTRDFPDTYESYENQISRQDYYGLCHGVALYRQAIMLCNSATVSTWPLAETIAPLIAGGIDRTFVIPNGLDDRFEAASLFAQNKGTPGDKVSIFYGSGTKAHNRDFTSIAAPALLGVLARDARCRLVIVGHLRLDKRFDTFADRITRFPLIDNLDTYWSILASCDINIAVLQSGPIADGKSEIKWLEAALLGVPSIVSATRTFENVVEDGVTGLIAYKNDDWYRHLSALIDDNTLRRSVGTKAREIAIQRYGAAASAAKLASVLSTPKTPIPGNPLRKRVLICNVFFAPQSIGGATHVVEDNVEHLVADYGDEFEVSIVSTYDGMNVGELKVHNYRGCPIYRIGTPLEKNMNWRPFNSAVIPAFRRVLEVAQPDLVHFHCVQRLTASIVQETLQREIPYVITVHDAWWISDHQFMVDQDDRLVPIDKPFDATLPAGVTRPESLERSQRLKSLLNSANATLAVSQSFADLYRQAGIGNVINCKNGLSNLGASLPKTSPADRVIIGHIGGRSVHKGAALLEVVLRLNSFCNLSLIMIDGSLEEGEETVEVWGATPVSLRAPVKKKEISRLYSEIDVLVAPSIWPESYGLVVREALHFGCWVVASDRGALSEDIVEGENGFSIDPSTTTALATILTTIDSDVRRFKAPSKRQSLRRSSLQVKELISIYRECFGSPHS